MNVARMIFAAMVAVSTTAANAEPIRLQAKTIQPEKAGRARLLSAGSQSSATVAPYAVYLIQYAGIIPAGWRKGIAAHGGKVYGYIPDNAYLVGIASTNYAALAAEVEHSYLGEFLPEYKYDAAAIERKLADDAIFTVSLFEESECGKVAEAICASEGCEILDEAGESICAKLTLEGIRVITQLWAVHWIEPYIPSKLCNDVAVNENLMNVRPVWPGYETGLGLTGKGQIVGVCDTGLDTGDLATLHEDVRGRVIAAFGIGNGGWADRDGHGTHVVGSLIGDGKMSDGKIKGVAYEANLVFQEQIDATELLMQAYTNGVRIHSNSYGATGGKGSLSNALYSAESAKIDSFMFEHPDMLVLFAAGNEGIDNFPTNGVIDSGPSLARFSLRNQATSKNTLVVGASETYRTEGEYSTLKWYNHETSFNVDGAKLWPYPVDPICNDYATRPWDGYHQGMAAFSSRGPCRDGRTKPDIVAPGTGILSMLSSVGLSNPKPENPFYHDECYSYRQGTSMATPLVAGAATLVRQWLVERWGISNPDAATIKALLLAGAKSLSPGQYMTGAWREIPGFYPNNVEGWGQANVRNTVEPPVGVVIKDGQVIALGDEPQEFWIQARAGTPLSIVMAYADAPGLPSASQTAPKLVNDLDLSVTSPSGRTYHPNSLSGPDRLNNVEGVRIAAEDVETGVYVATVRVHSIPKGMDTELTGGREDATRYSLVANGGFVHESADQCDYVYFVNSHGSVSYSSRAVIVGLNFGMGNGNALPTATSFTPDVERFDGWYDLDGNRVTENTIVTPPMLGMYYYARWRDVAVNDDWADAIPISGESGSTDGSTRNSRSDADDPLVANLNEYATTTVWWVWTAPTDGYVHFTTRGSAVDTWLGVSRHGLGNLNWLCGGDKVDGASAVTFYATQGMTYYVEVAGADGAEGDVRLNWEMTEYASWIVSFDGDNGFSYWISSRDAPSSFTFVDWGQPVGTLPQLGSSPFYSADGWWTEPAGGERVTTDTVPTGDVTYFAHWIPANDNFADAFTGSWVSTNKKSGFIQIETRNATLEANDRMLEIEPSATNTVWFRIDTGTTGVARLCFNATHSHAYEPDGEEFDPLVAVYRVKTDGDVELVASGFGKAVSNGSYADYIVGIAGHRRMIDPGSIASGNFKKLNSAPYGRIALSWHETGQIEMDAQGGSFGGGGIQFAHPETNKSVGEEILANVPERDGYAFDGWWTAPEGGEPVTPETVLQDGESIYAHWHPRPGNDKPDGAEDLPQGAYGLGGVTVTASNVYASTEGTDPLADAHDADATLWWKLLRLPYSGVVQFNTAGSTRSSSGELLDTVMGLYRSTWDVQAQTYVYDELAFNDDIELERDVEHTTYLRTSSNSVEVAKYDDVYVEVGSYRKVGNLGDIVLNWSYEKLLVMIDPAGGTVETNAVMVPVGAPLAGALDAALPSLWRDGYRHFGWRMANNTIVMEDTPVSGNHALTALWQPWNDDFAAARTLNPVGPPIWEYEVANSNATVEAGEPLAAAWPGVTNTLWWTWTAPADGAARFSTTNSVDDYGREVDTVLGIYTGDAPDALVEVVRGDDCAFDDIPHFWSAVEFNAVSGTTYRICVGVIDKYSRQVSEGTIRLAWTLMHEMTFDAGDGAFAGGGTAATFTARHGDSVTPPAASRAGHTFVGWFDEGGAAFGGRAVKDATYHARWEAGIANDNFENAATIGGMSGSVSQSNDGASVEAGEPLAGCIGNSAPAVPHSLWWRWTAPANGTVVFDTTDSTYLGYDDDAFEYRNIPYQTVMGIYTGAVVSNLTTVSLSGRNTDGEGNELAPSTNRFEVTKGTTYHIGVAGRYDNALNGSQQGVIVLNWGYEYIVPVETLDLLDENESESMVRTAVSLFSDLQLDDVIDGSADRYNDFAVWVNDVIGDAGEVKASVHVAASYLLRATSLFENEPEVKIDGAEVATVNGGTSMTLTVTVKDGETPKEVSAEAVAALFEATTDLGDWDSPGKKLAPHAEAVTVGNGSTVTIRVTPGDGTVPRAFLRIRK